MGSNQTRGIRNNNPLNLRDSKSLWKGEKSVNNDAVFEEFETMTYGLRAGIINMRTLHTRGVNTLRKMINTWAPPVENNTTAYLDFVQKSSGLPIDGVFKFDNETIFKIIKPMVKIESSFELTKGLFDEAWQLI